MEDTFVNIDSQYRDILTFPQESKYTYIFDTIYKNNIGDSIAFNINDKRYDTFLKKYSEGIYYQNVSILVSEWANSGDCHYWGTVGR